MRRLTPLGAGLTSPLRVDFDPFGIDILLMYLTGPSRDLSNPDEYSLPAIQHVGISSADCAHLPPSVFIELTPADRKRGQMILERLPLDSPLRFFSSLSALNLSVSCGSGTRSK